MKGKLENRVYVVTGGSKGFGLAIARGLVAEGARVGLLSRNQEGLDQAVAEIGRDHALGVAVDVGHREDISRAFEQMKTHFGRFDGLVVAAVEGFFRAVVGNGEPAQTDR